MTEHMLAILVAEMVFAAAVWLTFPPHYHLTTSGRWSRSAHGWNVMTLATVLALMIGFTLGSLFLPEVVSITAALVLWPGVAIIGVHRHWLLWRDQHTPHVCRVCGKASPPGKAIEACGVDEDDRPVVHVPSGE